MPRKKKEKMYFTMDTEAAIIEYNKSSDFKLRNKIYEESIKYPFEKLAENILNTFKFSYFDVSKEDIQMEVVSTATTVESVVTSVEVEPPQATNEVAITKIAITFFIFVVLYLFLLFTH